LQGKPPYDERQEFPLPDVILLDLKMPQVDGFEVLKWLRSQTHDDVSLTPVIVMSGSDALQDVRRAYKLGASLYVTKPTDLIKLRERLKLLTVLWREHASTVKSATLAHGPAVPA
jgi:DNA-binding response OmpR family regulator